MRPARQMRGNHVVPHAIGGPDIVFRVVVRQHPAELGLQVGICVCKGDAGGTALPHAHQPHRIDAKIRKRIPLLRGDRRQGQSLPVTRT